jgi:hypothetical protein
MLDGGEIWGSAFWEMRELLGKAVADKLLFDAWFRFRSNVDKDATGAAFVRQIVELDRSKSNPAHTAQITGIFARRQLKITE